MRMILNNTLKITLAVGLICLSACETKPQQRVTYMRGPAEDTIAAPMAQMGSQQPVAADQAPMLPPAAPATASAYAPAPEYTVAQPPAQNYAGTPAPAVKAIPTFYTSPSSPANPLQQPSVPPLQATTSSQPAEAAYGDPNYRATPHYYPPIGMGVHVSR